jgi:cardiolipin synthase
VRRGLRGRPTPFALAAVVLLALFGESGCTLISSVIASEKRDVYHFDHPFGAADPAFRRSMDTFGNLMVGGNAARLLKNGDEIFPVMTRAIREAKVSVNLETYIFKDDKAGELFTDALIEAAKRGVEVRVLLDATGGKAGKFFDRMKDAKVNIRIYRPVRLWTIHKIGKRTHRKILVVDGAVCYTGGLGIDARWLGDARNPEEWRDTMVEVTGPVTGQMQAIFGEDWTYTTGEILAGDKQYPRIPPAGDVQAQAIKVSRGDSSSLAKMLYYVAIQSAEKSIYIQNAYFVPDKQVREALVAAVKRGVDVQVMVPGKHIDIPLIRSASRGHYGELLEGGVKIFEYTPTMLHNKVVVVDGIFSTLGSINFDARSMAKNAEESLAFYDAGLASKMIEMFDDDKKRCLAITYANWKKRGFGTRVAETFSWLWEPLY